MQFISVRSHAACGVFACGSDASVLVQASEILLGKSMASCYDILTHLAGSR
jgi:hypothetical protein